MESSTFFSASLLCAMQRIIVSSNENHAAHVLKLSAMSWCLIVMTAKAMISWQFLERLIITIKDP